MGLPRYSEGGASDSSDEKKYEEAVFVEAPPVEEPPPLPPPLEAAPSRGEEVMQRVAEASARMDTEAWRALEEEFVAVSKPHHLRLEDREMCEAVRTTGEGFCARCRWMSGCVACDEDKAWRFACRSTLWHTADEDLRPKTKPRGRPKKQAG